MLLAPAGDEPTGLDAFRPVPGMNLWMGKYPVTNSQFARFIAAGGYDCEEYWSDAGRVWLTGAFDSQAPDWLQDWLQNRPPHKRNLSHWWDDRQWNSPFFPVVGITWFEAEAYARWLSKQLRSARIGEGPHELLEGLEIGYLMVRLPTEAEWEAVIGGRGAYPWGARFDRARLNCAESWVGRRFSHEKEWEDWIGSDTESWREASTTAVTTYPRGVSQTGVWDGCGNVWEWMGHPYGSSGPEMALRGGAWSHHHRFARVSDRSRSRPGTFLDGIGVRVVVGPVLRSSSS